MQVDAIIKLLPVAVLLGFVIWLVVRSRRSYRIQEESTARQKEMMAPFFESVELARYSAEIARSQLEVSQELLAELKALRSEMKR